MQDQVTQAEDQTKRSFLVALVVLTFAMNLVARGVPETFAVFLLPVQKGSASRARISRSPIPSTCWPSGSPGRSPVS